MDSFNLSQYKFRSASFNEDLRGCWYFNAVFSYTPEQLEGKPSVVINLGYKEAATGLNQNKA